MTAAIEIAQNAEKTQAQRHAKLVEMHHGLVRKIAYRVLRRLPDNQISVELDDLVNIGMLGLFEADRKYDPKAGQSFESFAEFRIRGAMLDELRKRDFFPRRLRAKANRLARAESKLRTELGREPTREEMAAELDVSVSKLQKMRRDTLPYSFVDQSDPAIQLRSERPSAFEALARQERRDLVVQALHRLPEREQLVLDLYFNQDFAQREIAKMLNLTEGRISQIKSAALKRMRTLLRHLD